MGSFEEIIFEIKKPKVEAFECASCKILNWCGILGSGKCVLEKTCDNTLISVCLECEKRNKDIMSTIISGEGCR